jgi:hypothetical protein
MPAPAAAAAPAPKTPAAPPKGAQSAPASTEPAANDAAELAANEAEETSANDTSEAQDEGTEGDGAEGQGEAGEGEEGAAEAQDEAEGEGKDDPKKQPAKLRAALRAEKRAIKRDQQASAKLAQAEQLRVQVTQERQQLHEQVEGWKRQVQPQLARLSQLERAAKGGQVGEVLRQLGLEPRAALQALTDEEANPIPENVRRELEEARRFREEQQRAQDEQQKKQKADEQRAQVRSADWQKLHVGLEVGAFDSLKRYQGEHGADAVLDNAYAVQRQLAQAEADAAAREGRDPRAIAIPTLLRELESRAARLYGKPSADAAAPPATPAPKAGQRPAGTSAAPSAPAAGKKPAAALTSRMAAEGAGAADENVVLTPDQYRERTKRLLRGQLGK